MTRVRGAYRWTDCGYLGGYRIQAHHREKMVRLLNPRGGIVCSGTYEDCRRELVQIAEREQLKRTTGTAIVLLHGLARNAWSMGSMERFLKRSRPAAEVFSFQYASTTASITRHAQHLIRFLESVQQAEEVHFVGHSLGNIVLRRAFRMAEQGEWTLPRLGKHVMLGPPNQGSQIARKLTFITPLRWFNGPSFLQLGRDWPTFEQELAPPPCPYGIIAGRLSPLDRAHLLLDGPNDVLVTVEETKLPGASDFSEMNVGHAWMMNSRRVQRAVDCFFRTAQFTPIDSTE
ncbi:MAG: alpha/beta fold hydrolase [Pirellulales bacterium]